MSDKWIENQSKALADYAVLKFRGAHSEAHDHLRLYTEDVLREAMERQADKIEGLVGEIESALHYKDCDNAAECMAKVLDQALTAYKEEK